MKAPAANLLRIGGGNVYVKNPEPAKAARIAANAKPHSWGWSEGGNLPQHVRKVRGYDSFISTGFKDPRAANDCIMQVRKSLNVVHHSMTRVCDEVPGSRVAKSRVFSMVAYEAPMLGKGAAVCHVAVHPNWIAGIDSAANPVAREYIESMKHLRAMLTFAKAMGWIIVVTGDFNSRKHDKKPFETIYDVFKDFRLSVKTEGIDGIAYDRRLSLVEWHTIPKSQTKSDHDFWVAADFKRKGAKAA